MSDLSLLQSILITPLADVLDLPDYITPPPGTYKLLVNKVDSKEIGDKPAVTIEYAIIACTELADKDDEPPKEGDLTSEAFFFGDPDKVANTLSLIKSRFGGLAEALNASDVLGLLNSLEGLEITCTIGNRPDKKDKTKNWPSFKNIELA